MRKLKTHFKIAFGMFDGNVCHRKPVRLTMTNFSGPITQNNVGVDSYQDRTYERAFHPPQQKKNPDVPGSCFLMGVV